MMNDDSPPELTIRQQDFIQAMLSAPSVPQAAKMAKIGRETGYRWLKLPHVQAALQSAKEESYQHGLGMLKSAVNAAVTKLLVILEDNEATPSVQVRACEAILRHGIEIHSIQTLEQRIAELERLLQEK